MPLEEEKKDESGEFAESPAAVGKDSKEASPTPQRSRKNANSILRRLFLEVPLVLLFAVWLTADLAERLGRKYFLRLVDLQMWSLERAEAEVTYMHRYCSEEDQTAYDTEDLVVSPEDSLESRVEHMLTHGVSVYPNLLSTETATAVRDFILEQNLRNEDMIDVIENENRWSFGVRVDQHPSVVRALTELFRNEWLVDSLEAIVGPNPAIIEFTGITSAYGAKSQRWHQDVVPEGSAAKYARSFVPSYSLFIPLQNITKAMGATDICPGTHLCASGALLFCEESGFAVSGKRDNWPAGWGALVNQQTSHRGAPHEDPDGPNRVLFILTFAPRPETTETRMLGTGGSYSLHWSQWGHTLRDFADIPGRMKQPWRFLRTMGLYSKGQDWGWDFLASAGFRTANSEGGYDVDSLYEFVEKGGLKFLPKWLQVAELDDESADWARYAVDTVVNVKAFAWKVYTTAAAAVSCLLLTTDVFLLATRKRPTTFISASVFVLLSHIILFTSFTHLEKHVDNTQWAKNILGERQFNWPEPVGGDTRPATLPLRSDVLITDEYQSTSIGTYADVIDYSHPGNARWVSTTARSSVGYHLFGRPLQEQLCSSILQWNYGDSSRLLTKNSYDQWYALSQDEGMFQCHKDLLKRSSPLYSVLLSTLQRLITTKRFDPYRDTAMNKKWMVDMLRSLELDLTHRVGRLDVHRPSRSSNGGFDIVSSSLPSLPDVLERAPPTRARSVLPRKTTVGEPFVGAWMEEGDLVEAMYESRYPEWYRGYITGVNTNMDTWIVEYEDGETDFDLCRRCVRPYRPYMMNEAVDVRDDNGDGYYSGHVVRVHGDELYDVRLEDGTDVLQVSASDMRRISTDRFEAGSLVRVDEQHEANVYYVHGDGTVDVVYQDGDFEARVDRERLE